MIKGWSVERLSGGVTGGWKWVHVPAKGRLVCVCHADGWLVYSGHYWQGRVWRCREDHCTLCGLGLPVVSRLLLPVWLGDGDPAGVLELPGRCSEGLLVVRSAHGTLRGVSVGFGRKKVGGQGQIEVLDEIPEGRVEVTECDVGGLERWLEGQEFWRGKLSV